MTTLHPRIIVRHGTAAQASSADEVLSAGEWGYETNTGVVKIGDGSTAWTSLPVAFTVGAMATDAEVSAAISAHAGAADPHGDRAYAAALVDDLSGVSNASTARTNLGLGTIATQAASSVAIIGGTMAGTFTGDNANHSLGNPSLGGVSGSIVVVHTGTAGQIGLAVRGSTAQTADLQQWQNSAGTAISKVAADGNITTPRLIATDSILTGWVGDSASTGPRALFDSASITFVNRNATQIPVTVKGYAAQTADLQQWQNSAGTVLAQIKADGAPSFSGAAATTPAPATDLATALTLVNDLRTKLLAVGLIA